MNYRCPGCGDVLEYDVKMGMLWCNSCGSFYDMETAKDFVADMEEASSESLPNSTLAEMEADDDTMELRIYHCNSCGANIMTAMNEVANFCSYCGLQNIIFERISKEKKPQKILPFKLSKQEALTKIRGRLKKLKYAPDSVMQLSVEKVYGMYVPYWIYHTKIFRNLHFSSSKNEDGAVMIQGEAELTFALDGSKNLDNGLATRLDPFPMKDLINFEPEYLAGFYAEKYDVSSEMREEDAHREAVMLMDYKICKDNNISNTRFGKEGPASGAVWENEDYKLKRTEYALLPVYFVTVRENGRPLLILVNGYTGKVVSNITVDKNKMKAKIKQDAILFSILYCAVFVLIGSLWKELFGMVLALGFPIALLAGVIIAGLNAKERYEHDEFGVKSTNMNMISKRKERS